MSSPSRTFAGEVLTFNLCDYSDAYILVRGDITFMGRNEARLEVYQKW